jgi:hypothetical protein
LRDKRKDLFETALENKKFSRNENSSGTTIGFIELRAQIDRALSIGQQAARITKLYTIQANDTESIVDL